MRYTSAQAQPIGARRLLIMLQLMKDDALQSSLERRGEVIVDFQKWLAPATHITRQAGLIQNFEFLGVGLNHKLAIGQ